MKVLHINTGDCGGGAAIAARRHCEAMRAAGIDASLLSLRVKKPSAWVSGAVTGRKAMFAGPLLSRLNSALTRRHRPFGVWSEARFGIDISRRADVAAADVIFLHWVNGGFLTVNGVGRLLNLGKPVVWYLHDMWPMTGGCHHSLDCQRFSKSCGHCPLLDAGRGSTRADDISRRLLRRKAARWANCGNLQIIAPSQWLADCAARSSLFGKVPARVLRNPLDTDLFKPLDKAVARQMLNLPDNKKIILFGADSATHPYKGWPYLADALEMLDPQQVECIVFGNSETWSHTAANSLKIHPIGKLTDPLAMVAVYSAADVFVTPSQADNYPNVLVEAMACGTPCVGFNIGGIPEIIRHGVSGLIAPEVSARSLAQTINSALAADFADNARQQILSVNSYAAYATAVGQCLPEVVAGAETFKAR